MIVSNVVMMTMMMLMMAEVVGVVTIPSSSHAMCSWRVVPDPTVVIVLALVQLALALRAFSALGCSLS